MSDVRAATGASFNSSAALYERVRPTYPAVLIDDAVRLAGLHKNARILEIGSGTGKATEAFAARGYSLDCIDVGSDLTAIAIDKFKNNDRVACVVDSFENWDPEAVTYDLVLAAASFHWIDPKIRFTKSAAVLKQKGSLALLSNKHTRKSEGFFARVQAVYQSNAPSMERIASERTALWTEPVLGEDMFEEPIIRHYPWVAHYSADDYIALLGTYSDHLRLPADERAALFSSITALIHDEFDGVVQKHYDAILTLRTLR